MNPALRREVERDSAYMATVRQLTPDTTKNGRIVFSNSKGPVERTITYQAP
jgi:hypothetical protein